MWHEPIDDVFRGSDGQLYATTYFAIKADRRFTPPMKECEDNVLTHTYLSNEMIDCRWIKVSKKERWNTKEIPVPSRIVNLLVDLHDELR
jgi:hypothetical protein